MKRLAQSFDTLIHFYPAAAPPPHRGQTDHLPFSSTREWAFRDQVKSKGCREEYDGEAIYCDVTLGGEKFLGVSRSKLYTRTAGSSSVASSRPF